MQVNRLSTINDNYMRLHRSDVVASKLLNYIVVVSPMIDCEIFTLKRLKVVQLVANNSLWIHSSKMFWSLSVRWWSDLTWRFLPAHHPRVRVRVRINSRELRVVVEPRWAGAEHLRVAAAPPGGSVGEQRQGQQRDLLGPETVQGLRVAAGSQLRGQDPLDAEVRHSAAASLHRCSSGGPVVLQGGGPVVVQWCSRGWTDWCCCCCCWEWRPHLSAFIAVCVQSTWTHLSRVVKWRSGRDSVLMFRVQSHLREEPSLIGPLI